ncbi:hypothetical protein [Bacillus litorisediminis]|uniref:hypothetical protein n=1 Tax=Bacillus litorisediminis TaxID=2922713 RepID=UPI001FAB71FB|nr:hypothetical protein [Bacillus litorisediminis]
MKIRVGVVGPKDSVQKMLEAGKDFQEIDLIPFIYEKTEETETIINKNRDLIHHWFFSGQAPYYFALSKGIISEEEGSFTPLNGSSLLGTLLKAFMKEGKILNRLSLDTIQVEEIEKVKESFSLQDLTIYTNPYHGYIPALKLIEFHKNLYEAGQVDAAITCLNSVYTALTEMGIPAFRVVPSELAVHRAYSFIKERAQTSVFRKAQLVILGVEVIFPSPSAADYPISFKRKHQVLELRRVLLDFVEEINGSIVEVGDGLFYIYSTRGELELFTKSKSIFSIIEECKINSQLSVRMGIGYGLTVLEAEEHVRISFEHARAEKGPVVVITNEDKEVRKLLDSEEQVMFQMRSKGAEWEQHFKDDEISSSLAAKIHSLSHHYEQTELTSHELARWLKSTERNARRILCELERIGLAQVTGEESFGRGRPRKIYELKF